MLVPHPSERLVMGMSSVGSMPTPRLQRNVGDTGVTTEKIISRPDRTGHLAVQLMMLWLSGGWWQQLARMDSDGSMPGSLTNTLHGG